MSHSDIMGAQIPTRIRTLSPRMENIHTFKCRYHNFPGIPHMSAFFENSWNYISMHCCSSISLVEILEQIGPIFFFFTF